MRPPRSEGFQYAMEKEQRTTTNSSRKNEVAEPKCNDAQLGMSGDESKSNAMKNNIA